MPYSTEDKKKAITRLRKIRGQAEALERVIAEGATCSDVLQQLAAMRGGVNGLMRDVLEGHLRETFLPDRGPPLAAGQTEAAIVEATHLIRSYLK